MADLSGSRVGAPAKVEGEARKRAIGASGLVSGYGQRMRFSIDI